MAQLLQSLLSFHGPAEEVSLTEIATHLQQSLGSRLRFDNLRHGTQSQARRHLQNCRRDRIVGALPIRCADERTIDLHVVKRETTAGN